MLLNNIKSFNNNELIIFFKQNNLNNWVSLLEERKIDGQTLLSASEYQIKIWSKVRTNDLWQIIIKIKTNPDSFINPFKSERIHLKKPSINKKDHWKLENIIGNNINKPYYCNEENDGYLKPVGNALDAKNQSYNNSKSKIPIPLKPVSSFKEYRRTFEENKMKSFPNFNLQSNALSSDKDERILEIPQNKIIPQAQLKLEEINKPFYFNEENNGKPKIHTPLVPRRSLNDYLNKLGENKFNSFPKINSKSIIRTATMNQSPILRRQKNVTDEDECIANKMIGRELPPLPFESNKNKSMRNRELPTTPDDIVPENSPGFPGLPLKLRNEIHTYDKKSLKSILNRPLPPIPVHQSYSYDSDEDMKSDQERHPAPIPSEDGDIYIPPSFPKVQQETVTGSNDYIIMEKSSPNFGTFQCTEQHAKVPYVNTDNKDNLNNEQFYRNTDRKGAKLLLRGLEDGVFLFRHSRNPIYFLVISIIFENTFFHVRIIKTGNKIRCEGEWDTPEFYTLNEFVRYYQSEPIDVMKKDKVYSIFLKPKLPINRV